MFYFIRNVNELESILLKEVGLHSTKEEESPEKCDIDLSVEAMQKCVFKKVLCLRIPFYLVVACAVAHTVADQRKRATGSS